MAFKDRTLKAFTLAAALAVASVSTPVSAQGLFFDWGGGQTSGSSGKEVVAFRGGTPGEVIVSFGDRRLYLVTSPGQAFAYPIAIPRDQSRWSGVTSVTDKRENPSWTPTPTMRAENPRLPMWVPGGHPMNPLGTRALYLGSSMYRIHGTDAPWTIGSAVSKGCIRMYNQDVADLYPRVRQGSKVTVTWNRYSSAPMASNSYAPTTADAAPEKPKRTYYRAVTPRRAAAAAKPVTASASTSAAGEE